MIHEVKSGEQVVATITQRHVVAFQINIPGTFDMQSLDVPVWANTVAIDADGSIWAYESTVENVRLLSHSPDSWVDKGRAETKWFRWAKWLASLIGQNRRLTFAA